FMVLAHLATAYHGPNRHIGNISDSDRHTACCRLDDDVSYVVGVLKQAQLANHKRMPVLLNKAAARRCIGVTNRIEDFAQADTASPELIWVHIDLICFGRTSLTH